MNFNWGMSGRQSEFDLVQPTEERVLIEYDGPRLTVQTINGRKFVAYVADENDQVTRWLRTPITEVELRAFLQGKISIRDVVGKLSTVVVDVNRSGLSFCWPLEPSVLPEGCLPERTVFLPEFARVPIGIKNSGRVAFECDGEAVRDSTIMFACLAAVMRSLQELWSSIAPDSGVNTEAGGEWGDATLACSSFSKGSFAIEVDPRDRQAFAAIAAEYQAITRGSYSDIDKLRSALAARRPSLAKAYFGYLRALESYKVDVLFANGEETTFIGFDRATQIIPEIQAAATRASDASAREEVIMATGYFDGFMKLKGTFEFFDIATGLEYKGKVSDGVLKIADAKNIVIGRRSPRYSVKIHIRSRKRQKRRITLLSVQEI